MKTLYIDCAMGCPEICSQQRSWSCILIETAL